MKLQINRKRWVNGSNNKLNNEHSKFGDSMLLNTLGNMCCLGFLAKKCGATNDQIMNISTPLELVNDETHVLKKLKKSPYKRLFRKYNINAKFVSTKLCDDLVEVNDDNSITREKREAKITKLMEKIGVEVKFVGKE